MSRPNVYIFDVETQIEIIREMNDAEFAQYEIDKSQFDQEEAVRVAAQSEADAQAVAKTEAKKQALEALGLSQEVVNLLAE
jgi:DNA-directed RNA polymerase subunit L